MTWDLGELVRERLAAAPLPAAPADVRQFVADLPAVQPPRSRGLFGDGRLLVAAPVVLAVLIGSALIAGSITPAPGPTAPGATATPTTEPVPAGYSRFTAAGITFEYPSAWRAAPLPASRQDSWAHRYLGYLVDGVQCEQLAATPPAIGPGETCVVDAQAQGSLSLVVSHYPHPVPGESLLGRPPSFGPDSSFEHGDGQWYVTDPNGGLYSLHFVVPEPEREQRRPEIEALIDSVVTTTWTEPPPVSVDGWVEIASGGLSISYPDTWSAYAYMPWYVGMAGTGSPTVLLSSAPIEPCAAIQDCHVRNPPPGGAVLQFSLSSPAFGVPDWSEAADTVDGHPALRSAPFNEDGVEHATWTIRLYDSGISVLEIRVAHRGLEVAAVRRQIEDVIGRIQLPDSPPQ